MNFKGRLFRSFSYKMFPKLLIKKVGRGGGGVLSTPSLNQPLVLLAGKLKRETGVALVLPGPVPNICSNAFDNRMVGPARPHKLKKPPLSESVCGACCGISRFCSLLDTDMSSSFSSLRQQSLTLASTLSPLSSPGFHGIPSPPSPSHQLGTLGHGHDTALSAGK